MQKYKIISKYFFSDEYLKYTLKTKYYLTRNESETNRKINNKAFLQLAKNYEIPEKQNLSNKKNKLLDALLNFPLENFLFLNKLFSLIGNYIYNKLKIKQILTSIEKLGKITRIRLFTSKAVDPDKIKEHPYQPFLTDLSGKVVLLYQFEMDLIKSNLLEKTNVNYVPRGLRIKNKNVSSNKKFSKFKLNEKNKNKKSNNKEEKIDKDKDRDDSINIQEEEKLAAANSKSKLKTNKIEKISLNSLNEYYYLKLVRELKRKEKQFYSSQVNLHSELKFLQMRIRNRRISKANKIFKRIVKLINLNNYFDVEKVKSILHAWLILIAKNLGIYKPFVNEHYDNGDLNKKSKHSENEIDKNQK